MQLWRVNLVSYGPLVSAFVPAAPVAAQSRPSSLKVAANAPPTPGRPQLVAGQSCVVNDDGNVMKEASFFGEEILIETLP